MLNIQNVLASFPTLEQTVNGKRLAYLDSAASTQRPLDVINAISNFYLNDNANIHRAVHTLSERSTLAYEAARKTIAAFLNAEMAEECIITKGTTESINLVANGFASDILKPGDEVVVTQMEHHANLVPWQVACQRSGAHLKYIPINEDGCLDLENLDDILSSNVKLLAINHVSNTLGTINPIKDIITKARSYNIATIVDGTQAPAHMKVDVQNLGCDFYTISSHKMYGPMGVGILYGKKEWLDRLPPYQTGGDMIETVTMTKSTYAPLPNKFEAGTPNVSNVIALAKAIEFIEQHGLNNISAYESELHQQLESGLRSIPGVKIIGNAENKSPLSSFVVDGIHPHDLGTIADQHGVAIRTGHHCTMPIMTFFNIPATARASISMYSTVDDINQLLESIEYARKLFKKG